MTTKEKIGELAYWLVHDREKPETCPKVGYLGYGNGWSEPEWAVVCVVGDILHHAGLNVSDFFDYDTDSSD